MNLNTILLLGSIVVPAVGSLLFFAGLPKEDSSIKKLSYLVFGFPFIASVLLFFNFDPAKEYCFEILYSRMGLQELDVLILVSSIPPSNWSLLEEIRQPF